jgi:hypothetical protein
MLKQLNAALLLMTTHTAHRPSPHLSPPQRPPPCRCSSGAAACAKLEENNPFASNANTAGVCDGKRHEQYWNPVQYIENTPNYFSSSVGTGFRFRPD